MEAEGTAGGGGSLGWMLEGGPSGGEMAMYARIGVVVCSAVVRGSVGFEQHTGRVVGGWVGL